MITLTALIVAALSQPVTVDSLLHEMIELDSRAQLPSYTCAQASSYDRASKSPSENWFANGDVNQYIRMETNSGRKEWVMMDQDGPGAVVRIWSANPKGTLRIYLDGAATPAIEASMTDILGGKWKAPESLSYEASRGWNLYLPIPYAKHCKVTSDANGFYYQVNYRTYPAGAEVTSYSDGALQSAAATLKAVDEELSADRSHGMPAFGPGERGAMNGKTLSPGQSMDLNLPAGSSAVSGMMLSLKSDALGQATRSCIISARFDGEETIWCPVGDFFGSGVGVNRFQDLYRVVGEDGFFRCRWVMPYEKSGVITIHNLGAAPVTVDLRARVKPWQWDARSMHFHACWHQQYPVHAFGGRGTEDFNYVDVSGRGVFVGDTLSVLNPVKAWWGEGDEKIYVDGETFPSHFGTGTEDYYGYAWCCPDVFTRPFHAQPRCDGQERHNNWGRTTVTRSRGLDAIPFTKSLSMNIEVWHWQECDVEYAATSYFYALPGATTNRKPQPESAAAALVAAPPLPPPLRIEGAIECETLKPTKISQGTVAVAQDGFPEVWSRDKQLWVQAHIAGDFVELTVPAPEGKSRAAITVYATKSWDYAIVRFVVNGKQTGKDVDLFSGEHEVKATGPIELGEFEAKDGAFTIRVQVVGSNAKNEEPHTFFGLDCLVVKPVD